MVPVQPRRHARPHAALGAGLSLLALLGAPGAALAQGAGAAQAGPAPVPPLAVPVAVPPAAAGETAKGQEPRAPEAKGAAGQADTKRAETKPPEPRATEVVPEPVPVQGKAQDAKVQSAKVQDTKASETRAQQAKPQEAAKKSREPAPLVYAKVSTDPNPTLTSRTFLDTLRAAERYAAFAEAGGWERLPEDLARLKPGERHPAIPALRHHLTLTGDLPADAPPNDRLDPPLVAAIAAFQARHGLPDSGVLGRLTINALNVPAAVRQRQLAASAARLMGSKFPFGERYVVVNIPSAAVEAVENGAVARRYVAVVGSPDKATPPVETRITDINFNPTWTVPASVVKNEIIPQMRRNPGYLAKNHIRILSPAGEVDPTRIDWAGEKAVNYTLRQDPGFDNSLGQVRIDMPNRFAVYMHDTPAKSLFAASVRFHSHGCVRVGQVKELVGWLLQGTDGPNGPGTSWGPIEIETGIADGERRDIKLAKPIPVTFVYLTGYATPDGKAHFRDDIYNLDTPAAEPAATGAIPPAAAADAGAAKPTPATTAPATPRPGAAHDAKPVPARAAGARPAPARPAPAKPAAARPGPEPRSLESVEPIR
ncbi:murein L,D-transpeptidase YcbB/YkuD [Methylobacterium sp. PvP062]|jgi:murein L,D-transpeptidase YcbB/YkuD|uniref:Murein L,D-transpeptidase YcbB/YkuD n=1 Tax=Methylobacterium radiotolerans TaxID=31998 RepID=A0ABV2NIM7_9HYPH|nr:MULTISPECIES: L,D-transpeptidase family protein [Methylobacterium]MCX7330693.1 L,D-transpeptidase family protein [Hyphomicrobiales bacterium]MBP2496901.1 murein L,D-transpeptidase YcbB/YkuD [Methylobacterium sp. PvP105]MBP2503228.1 murein L,D-transpeptidase YcbB/YkuD [Methylobacterium sp. PvP109]RUP18191.1 MAG: murein L,D-transpeptidase [Methylobacterium sp.]UIY40737.1 L,D-transpeptidase family protein [Methylobacterium radiotolerans]